MTWTDERVDRAKQMFRDGYSAQQIANDLGGISRNAVIGKLHRAGVKAKYEQARPTKHFTRPNRTKPARVPHSQQLSKTQTLADNSLKMRMRGGPVQLVPAEPRRKPSPNEPVSKRLSLVELTEHTCKFPIGDPGHDDFHFCGCEKELAESYCEFHMVVAYQVRPLRQRTRGIPDSHQRGGLQ